MDLQGTQDEDLVLQFYQGDEEALAVVFKRYKDNLFNYALRLSGNRADADEAVSHAFMMVCQKRYTLKPGASFKTWLFTVAHHLCISRLKGQNKFFSLWSRKNDMGEEQMIDLPDPSGTARDVLDQKETAALVQKALHRLPKEQKEALILREFQKFSYDEISQVLNCSLEKVKVLIFRARQNLKNTLPPVVVEEGR